MTTSIGDLPSNKLISLALNGYNPFQPDVGIFSGAYQGFLYPNPTTIHYPGFNAYAYTEPSMSTYVPSATYTGLGVGNPGIDYKNAGHILGLLDTFARMSYGIGCWKSIRDGDETPGGQAVEILIPMTDGDGESAPLGAGNIYPAYSEVPSDWVDGFTIESDGRVVPDPRARGLFPSPGRGHTPTTAPIDEAALQLLFGNRSIYSYFGMPQYFRSVISSLASSAAELTDKASFIFTVDNPAYFNNYCHQQFFFSPPPDEHYEQETMGTAYVQCAVLDATEALETLTGSTSYHDGVGGENEYRSLTELNSVINLIPLQMVGATYWTDTKGYRSVFPPGGPWTYIIDDQTSRGFRVASYMIADFIINVSDVPPDPDDPTPGVVVIDGTATVHSLITDPTAYYFTETRRMLPVPITSDEPGEIITTEWGCTQEILKSVEIYISANNTFGWDGIWLGGGEAGDSAGFLAEVGHGASNGGNSDTGFNTLDQSDLVVPFNKEIALGVGCMSIRMRVFLRNRHTVGQRPFTGTDNWVAEEVCHNHGNIFLPPYYHCHYYAGVHYNGWIGDPDSVPDNLASPNMELSFTVTGTRIAPMAFAVSL